MALLLATVAAAVVLQGAPLDVPDDLKVEEVTGILEAPPLRTFRCTAYAPTGNRTATGTIPHWGTVAVDPSVIPLGSRLVIEGYDAVFTAEDTGGGVHGLWVDVFFPTAGEAIRFGSRPCRVGVL